MSEDNALLEFDLLSNLNTLNQSRGKCFRSHFFVSWVIFALFSLYCDLHQAEMAPGKQEWCFLNL